jgi:hypothetical protein
VVVLVGSSPVERGSQLGVQRIFEGQRHRCPVGDAGIAESLDGSCGAMVTVLDIGSRQLSYTDAALISDTYLIYRYFFDTVSEEDQKYNIIK